MKKEGLITGLDFSQALKYLKQGNPVQRAGWNGKGMFIYLNRGSHDFHDANSVAPEKIDGVPLSFFDCADAGTVTRLPNINMKSASGSTVTGWLASQTDMLAEDWQVIYPGDSVPDASPASDGLRVELDPNNADRVLPA